MFVPWCLCLGCVYVSVLDNDNVWQRGQDKCSSNSGARIQPNKFADSFQFGAKRKYMRREHHAREGEREKNCSKTNGKAQKGQSTQQESEGKKCV